MRFDLPGVPMYLQFKRSECMIKSSAKEIQNGANLATPFHRFHLMDQAKSNQHRLLLQLDDGTNQVFYAAPRFHQYSEINAAWNTNTITARSIFVAPRDIGSVGPGSHSIAYDRTRTYCCSEIREIRSLTSGSLLQTLVERLSHETQSLEEQLPSLVSNAENAAELDRGDEEGIEDIIQKPTLPAVERRSALSLSRPKQLLRDLSDIAAKVFGAQLVIVQPKG